MNSLKENRPGHKAGLRRSLAVIFAAITLIASTIPVGSQTAQATFNIDLGAAVNPANITVLGASANDHLSGNGTANTFTAFPRAHALAVGDFNDDGIQDVAIGAPDADFTPTGGALRANAGAVYVVFGKATFAANTVLDTNLTAAPATQPEIRIFGANADDAVGFAVAAGDVNGDGNDDLIFGAPGFNSMTGTPATTIADAGAVYIIFGGTSLTSRTVDLATANPVNVLVTGEGEGDRFGSALAVGDVNGGSATTPDLLVGAPGSNGPSGGAARPDGGAAFLLQGGEGLANPGATTRAIDLAATPPSVRAYGKTGSRFGSSVAIGDINAGSAADLIVGAPTAARPDVGGDVAETGAVYAVFGGSNIAPTPPATTVVVDLALPALATLRLVVYGATSGDHLGASVAAGNVRGSGLIDLVMGAPDADGPADSRAGTGEVYFLSGGTELNPSTGTTERRIDVTTGTVNVTVYGIAAGDHLGSTVAIGRINTQANTDSIADVLIGAPGTASNEGAVHVFYGGPTLFLLATRDLSLVGQNDLTVTGQAAGDELGWAIASGFIDSNTGGDLILGAPFADPTGRADAGKVYVLLATAENSPPPNEPPTVTVTQPNGGGTVLGGVPFNINWTATDPNGDATIDHFDIFLSIDGGTTYNIKVNTSGPVAGNLRTFSWNVPTGLNTTAARIRVIAFDTAGATGQDDSNTNFTISDPGVGVTLTAPNGGEVVSPGATFNITWSVPDALAAQVSGFDLFLSTNNGLTFNIPITTVNPTAPALPGNARTFPWTVPSSLCTTSARVLVRATSLTGAISTDASNASFSIANPGPTVNLGTDGSFFQASNVLLLRTTTINGTEVVFVQGVLVEISNDEIGTQFFTPTKIRVKASGRKLLIKGTTNGQEIQTFWPDNAIRIIRITNPNCGLAILRVRRVGNTLVAAPALDGVGTESIQ